MACGFHCIKEAGYRSIEGCWRGVTAISIVMTTIKIVGKRWLAAQIVELHALRKGNIRIYNFNSK